MVLHFKLGNPFIKNVREKVCNKSKKNPENYVFQIKTNVKKR